jgi:hypothetical protein
MGQNVSAQADVTSLGALVAHATVSIRSSYSSQHLWAAEHFARLAADYECEHVDAERISIQHRAYVMTAVSEAVAFLEAFINELYQDAADCSGAADGLPPEMVRLMTEYWRSTDRGHSVEITKKYDMARVFAAQPRADAGHRPNDDVKYLIKLRNWLLHYRPKTNGEKTQRTSSITFAAGSQTTRFSRGSGHSWFPIMRSAQDAPTGRSALYARSSTSSPRQLRCELPGGGVAGATVNQARRLRSSDLLVASVSVRRVAGLILSPPLAGFK